MPTLPTQRYWRSHQYGTPGNGDRRVETTDQLTVSDWMTTFCKSGAEAITEVYAHDGPGIGQNNILLFAIRVPLASSDVLTAFAGAVTELIDAGFVKDDLPAPYAAKQSAAPTSNTGLPAAKAEPEWWWRGDETREEWEARVAKLGY